MKKTGLSLIIVGVVLIVAALGLAVYNAADSLRAEHTAEALLAPIAAAIEEQSTDVAARPEGGVVPEMPVLEQDGRRYIGVIDIPALSISLPVLDSWSYDLLKIAPCYYAGSYYTNDLVICAHNYDSHFNGLRRIEMGADVYFTAVNGDKYHYVIVNRETLRPEENDRMITADGTWDLTLFTCYIGGATRCTLRCTLAQD